jgi:dienelactone hydrolase
MRHLIPLAGLLAISPAPAAAQSPTSELDVTRFGVVLEHPDTRRVTVHKDVAYMTTPAGRQDLDIFLPPGLKAGEKRPAVIFFNAIGDAPGRGKVRRWQIYQSWPRLIAAHGMVGISMDADPDRVQESLRGVFRFLEQSGASHGVDATRLGVYAASANVTGATAYLFGDSAARGIRAAALFYGRPPAERLRTDLPVLFIVPEGDAPGLGPALPALFQRIIEAKAPWRITYGSHLPHAFDGRGGHRRFPSRDAGSDRILEELPRAAAGAHGGTVAGPRRRRVDILERSAAVRRHAPVVGRIPSRRYRCLGPARPDAQRRAAVRRRRLRLSDRAPEGRERVGYHGADGTAAERGAALGRGRRVSQPGQSAWVGTTASR